MNCLYLIPKDSANIFPKKNHLLTRYKQEDIARTIIKLEIDWTCPMKRPGGYRFDST